MQERTALPFEADPFFKVLEPHSGIIAGHSSEPAPIRKSPPLDTKHRIPAKTRSAFERAVTVLSP
jgi:hypothetical protein